MRNNLFLATPVNDTSKNVASFSSRIEHIFWGIEFHVEGDQGFPDLTYRPNIFVFIPMLNKFIVKYFSFFLDTNARGSLVSRNINHDVALVLKIKENENSSNVIFVEGAF